MPLYAVSLLFSLEVQAPDAPQPLQELAVHVVAASDEKEAEARGRTIGKNRENSYRNPRGDVVRDTFKAVIEVQHLIDERLRDGMEVASWMFRKGEVLVVDEDGVMARAAAK
jgi:hypothetical protein